MVTRNNRSRKENRRMAILHIIAALGNDAFTTHEVWHQGHQMVEDGVKFPGHSKRAFLSISRIDDLGQLMKRHPGIEYIDEMESWDRVHGRSRRHRTKLWMLR